MEATAIDNRYLSLTGLVFELDRMKTKITPFVEQMKFDYFGATTEHPIILHRKEIIHRDPPFCILKDLSIAEKFDSDLLKLLLMTPFKVMTVVIDKYEHKLRYGSAAYEPYNYCMTALVERYCIWLFGLHGRGDVMSESRGRKDDLRLKSVYSTIYAKGTNVRDARDIQPFLTSRELKVKPKSANETGLQLADLVAYPSFRLALARHYGLTLPDNFGAKVARVLYDLKYFKGWGGKLEGYGIKWLP